MTSLRSHCRTSFWAAVALIFLTATVSAGELPPPAEKTVDFERDIQPIFAKHCLECHGPEKQKSDLRLDQKRAAMRGGLTGPVIVPGKSTESRLLHLVAGTDPEITMPPQGDQLDKKQIALLRAWIDQGAVWPADAETNQDENNLAETHWSFQPIERPTIPETDSDWVRNPIDNFVLAKLKEQGVEPSPPADRTTLIRRLHLDLTGLPPTEEQLDRFLNDSSPKAYENLVDRLLDSPHFGERWGRHWLDKARYADSDGYEKDRPRPNAWRYRDWVIEAINEDMPFDQFTIEQLAGDLLPNATPEQKLATAFHRQTLTNTEGGTDDEQFRVEAVFDRVHTTGTVWLGLTVKCAQCHNHKYDPITQKEFYQLFAFFNNGDERNTQVPISKVAVEQYKKKKAEYDHKLHVLQEKLAHRREELASRRSALEKQLKTTLAEEPKNKVRYHPLQDAKVTSAGGAEVKRLEDGSFLLQGKQPQKDTYVLKLKTGIGTDGGGITGFQVEALAHQSLSQQGPGRADNGNFVLSEFRVLAVPSESFENTFEDKHRVALHKAKADFSQKDWPVKAAIDGDIKTGWAISPQMGKDHQARFLTKKPLEAKDRLHLKIELDQQYGSRHTLGRFRIRLRTGTKPGENIPSEVRQAVAVAPEKRTAKQKKTLLDYYVAQDDLGSGLQQQIAQLKKNAPKEPVMKVRIIDQRENNPRTTHVLRRGNFLQPQQKVKPDTPHILPDLQPREQQGLPDRLDLARWIVDPENPLTPRVTVNHIWEHLFGRGLVRTMNDFGVRGEKPTHPELLDWLATEFLRRDWSRKAMIRLIVNSATYRQSSRHRPELAQRDPRNNWLARQNRFRVAAEIIRDLYLATSGLLSRQIGGPSVYPPMPKDVADISYANNFKWTTSEGADRYRRGMYTFFKRTAPYPNLTTFDCPDSNTTTVQRRTSNTPLQALTTLNNRVFVEAARAFGRRILQSDHTAEADRLMHAFRLALARRPSEMERDQFLQLLAESRQWYHKHPEEAKELVGSYQPEQDLPVDESAAWVAVARMVLNLDEFITRE